MITPYVRIRQMSDGKLINTHGEQLWIAINEDWKNEPYNYLYALSDELQRRNKEEEE